MRAKRTVVADIQRQPELASHTTIISRVNSCCLEAGQRTWPLDPENSTVVLSKIAECQHSNAAAIRQGMYDLFLKDFRPLCQFATAHGTEVNMLRCMVDGTATPEFPGWQKCIQVAVCNSSNAVVAAALIVPVNAALAWMPILSVQPHLRGKGIGRKFVHQIVDLLASFFIESLLIPSSNESRLISWWIDQTQARKMNVDEVDVLVESFPCLCEIDKTKMLVARLVPAVEDLGAAAECSKVMQCRAENRQVALRGVDCDGLIIWEAVPNSKRPRSGLEDPP